jgi:hypothetical protein
MHTNPAVPGIEKPTKDKCQLVTGRALLLFLMDNKDRFRIEPVLPKGKNAAWWYPPNLVHAAALEFQNQKSEFKESRERITYVRALSVRYDRLMHFLWVENAQKKCIVNTPIDSNASPEAEILGRV